MKLPISIIILPNKNVSHDDEFMEKIAISIAIQSLKYVRGVTAMILTLKII